MNPHEDKMTVLRGWRRLWIEKYELMTLLLAIYAFFALEGPHNIILAIMAVGKAYGHKVEFDKLVPYFWVDIIIGLYALLLGHYWLGILLFLVGRMRKLDYGITPKEERHPVHWTRNNFGRQK